MRQLNQNLASVTGLLANDPDEVGDAVRDLNDVVGDVQSFVADNREALGTTSDKLASVTQALTDSLDDVKQFLHVAPTASRTSSTSINRPRARRARILALNNFANPITFLCGAVQAASRLGAEQSAKLCVQYLAPIVKNRQYNFLPIGVNLVRRRHGAAQRDHLQRGLDAAGLRSAAAAAGQSTAAPAERAAARRCTERRRCPRRRRWRPIPPTACRA